MQLIQGSHARSPDLDMRAALRMHRLVETVPRHQIAAGRNELRNALHLQDVGPIRSTAVNGRQQASPLQRLVVPAWVVFPANLKQAKVAEVAAVIDKVRA